MATAVKFSDEELELTILALEYFRRFHLGEYSDEDRPGVAKEIAAIERRLRDA